MLIESRSIEIIPVVVGFPSGHGSEHSPLSASSKLVQACKQTIVSFSKTKLGFCIGLVAKSVSHILRKVSDVTTQRDPEKVKDVIVGLRHVISNEGHNMGQSVTRV